MRSQYPILPVHSPPLSRSPSPGSSTPRQGHLAFVDERFPSLNSEVSRGSIASRHTRRSTASTIDSQHDIKTAINSPANLSPRPSELKLSELDTEINAESSPDAFNKEAGSRVSAGDGEIYMISGGRGSVRKRKTVVDLGRGLEDVIIIDWLTDDPENPINWTSRRKWAIIWTVLILSSLTALNVTSVAPMSHFGPAWFDTSRELFLLSLTVTMIAISLTPMILAPLSEVYGRNWIYQITSVITALLFIPQATSHSLPGLLVARWFQGMSCSVGNSMVGGTIADLFPAHSRGFVMNIFAMMIFIGQSGGGFIFGWVGMYGGIPWCYGLQGIAGALSITLNVLFLRETRADVLLSRRAKQITQETGIRHLCTSDLERTSLTTLMRVSLVRPFQFLFTEPIVTALSIWVGFSWACIFLGGTSAQLIFAQYGFNPGQQGSMQICLLIGGIIGFCLNLHQDHLYIKSAPTEGGKPPPEARLYYAAWAGLAFPLGLYVFAWVGKPSVPWQIPALFLCLSDIGIYVMYAGIYNYLADAYETYSSSAQAAQCFARNILSAVFPLFAKQLYKGMGYSQASTLVASVALALQVAPILILCYGERLRARSKVASALART
ncbi:major facilitator superfamily domain-containing protein [Kockovaella imperatae]|uniref:Major facilitator superfamily domain-containing protein n=1 Tax=Kockovaella imperatae TaxID=4999 RepID=A0A1Y1ULK3_9TREE|nr:major facilitator superfamily domain-containing protein [Kockovaella imperatae]ORX38933.1 major facilitator superfamily domain-containing protein [Kockovaella imperatae]